MPLTPEHSAIVVNELPDTSPSAPPTLGHQCHNVACRNNLVPDMELAAQRIGMQLVGCNDREVGWENSSCSV